MTLEYMKWVTNNANTLVANQTNLVACVFCRLQYETTRLDRTSDNCLICYKCGIDAVMVVKHSPLHGLAAKEQQELLDKWHDEGFTPIEE